MSDASNLISLATKAGLEILEASQTEKGTFNRQTSYRKSSSTVSLLSESIAKTVLDRPTSPKTTSPIAVPGTHDISPYMTIGSSNGMNAEVIHTMEGHTGGLRTVAVSPDGKLLYSCGEDKSIRVWSVGPLGCGCKLLHAVLDAHSGWVWTLLTNPSGNILYSGGADKTIRVWAVGTQAPPQLCHILTGHVESVCSLVVSRDGAFLYSGSDDSTIRVWDTSGGMSVPPVPLQILTGHTGYVSSLCLSPDCTTLYSAGMSGDNSVKMWRVCGLRPTSAKLPSSGSGNAATQPLAQLPPCRLLQTLTEFTAGVYTITISPDGRTLYGGGEDKSITLWAVDAAAGTGRLLRTLENVHDSWVRSLRLTPNGHILLSGSADTSIGVWEVNADGSDVRMLTQLHGHTGRVRCLRISPDGQCFYSGSSDTTIRCWQLK